MAGRETSRLSFDFIRTNKAENMSIASPLEEISKRGLYSRPINNPKAPKISNTIIKSPNRSKLNRLNSIFILGETKYIIEYARKEKLDIKTQATIK